MGLTRKTLLYLFIGISAFVAVYLYYVDYSRKKSVEAFLPDPRVGDVYKIKQDVEKGDQWLLYYRLERISADSLVFVPGKMMTGSSVDYLQQHFQKNSPVAFSRKDLEEIKDGKWKNYLKDNTTLVEIIRR